MSQVYPIIGCLNPDCVLAAGTVTYTAAGGAAVAKGKGYSVSRSAQGVFDVVLDSSYPHCISAVAGPLAASATDDGVEFISYTASTRTLKFRLKDDTGTAVDPADNDGFCFAALMQKSGLTPT